jgi:hypothetical protein
VLLRKLGKNCFQSALSSFVFSFHVPSGFKVLTVDRNVAFPRELG